MFAWSFSAVQLTLRDNKKAECPKVCMLVQKPKSDNNIICTSLGRTVNLDSITIAFFVKTSREKSPISNVGRESPVR